MSRSSWFKPSTRLSRLLSGWNRVSVGDPPASPFALSFAGATDLGLRKAPNEDAYIVASDLRLAVVSDGMGGHEDGERASRCVADKVVEYVRAASRASPDRLDQLLIEAVNQANHAVCSLNVGRADRPMGATVVAALFTARRVVIVHVGDSRCYRLRGGRVERLTDDHSIIEEFRRRNPDVPAGELTGVIAAYEHVVTRAVGVTANVEVDVSEVELEPGDTYLLCSDGIWGVVPESLLISGLSSSTTLDEACHGLIGAAKALGAKDNLTAILARVAVA